MSRRLCIAPMLDWTDRHFRWFVRRITRHTWLYTEMVVAQALLHGDPRRLLAYDPEEKPLALQVGGSNPAHLASAAALAEEFGYDEVNLNVGCPSPRVQTGRFGACLMAEPELVAECVAEMQARTALPVTVKTRIGIDEHDHYEFLQRFVATVAAAGCRTFVIHARKAWLRGLSPRENRQVPPLRREVVRRVKQEFPHLEVLLNGGICGLDEAQHHLAEGFDGVMIGRAAYHDPYLLAWADRRFYGRADDPPSRVEVLEAMLPYLERQLAQGGRLGNITRHLLGLYHGMPGARAYRRVLTEQAQAAGSDRVQLVRLFDRALGLVP